VTVALRIFTRHQLPLVEPWFLDESTHRWLGGPGWPRLMLDLHDRPLAVFRGARETGRHKWLAWDGDQPVGYIGCGTYDRWTRWQGDAVEVVQTLDVPSAAMSYVVAPAHRRRGYATEMIRRLLEAPELATVCVFDAGVEPENTASIAALQQVGFRAVDPTPDFEGCVHYTWHRDR
jgi:RimJ/RimL family protein N-acetyltransferase